MSVDGIKQMPNPMFLLAIAGGVTLLGAVFSWALAGGIPFVGIDDAAITRSYADNISRGYGYVYNIGGERVEGATSFLWVMCLTLIYAIFENPEAAILIICALFTLIAIWGALLLAAHLTGDFEVSPYAAVFLVALFLMATPSYFVWSIWTMMEVALWSSSLIWFVVVLIKISASENYTRTGQIWLCFLAFTVPLIRPEGVAVAIGLLICACLLKLRKWRLFLWGVICALLSFTVLTLFRLWYFGQPVPNTFYAKVSSDFITGAKDGLIYLLGFIFEMPFMEGFAVLWAILIFWAFMGFAHSKKWSYAVLILAASVVGILGVYAILGGDHFVFWRFYQPIIPLIYIAVIPLLSFLKTPKPLLLGVASIFILGLGGMNYALGRYELRSEFWLVTRGLSFGAYLQEMAPETIIGTGPAGGIALAYDGKILDLFGLNWVEMAHANPIKTGMRNHASFDPDIFWAHQPDLVTGFEQNCAQQKEARGFYGLFRSERFRSSYLPIQFMIDGACFPAYAKAEWMHTHKRAEISIQDWAHFEQILK